MTGQCSKHVLDGAAEVFVIALLVLALVAAMVLTAVWSPDKSRRKDAISELDRFMRWR
jgi:hypothetical protein